MEEFKDWTTEQVVKFLHDKGLSNVANKFQEKGVTGSRLATMNAGNLEEEFGIDDELRKKLVAELLPRLFPAKAVQKTVFNDSVHGHIEVHPLLVKIINTPQFQRLRNIKQLGAGYFVYPGACHNRFEHSIGTSHLAEKLVKSLQESQPELGITDQDVLCVTIAGLCHDLGHGPFSHLFDNLFIKEVAPEKNWTHENASVKMFNHLVESNGLKSEFKTYDLSDKEDMVFIRKLIKGLDANTENDDTDTGRPKEKNFLYEIVANKLTGIDVDKFDYFARDCHNLGIKNSFDHNRYIKMTRVLKVKEGGKERLQICVRNKEAANIYGMFYTRYRLHQQAYQHKTTNIIEIMICEALKKADPHLRIQYKTKDENGRPKLIAKKMSDAIHDMEAYMKLTDNVYYQILYSTEDNLEEAKALIQRIQERQLYKIIGQPTLLKTPKNKDDIFKEIEQIAKMSLKMEDGTPLIIVDVVTFDYGKEEKYKSLRFYSKNKQHESVVIPTDEVSHFLPNRFTEKQIRVYCRSDDDDTRSQVEKAFEEWCLKYNVAEHPQTQKRKLDVLLSDQGASHSTASNSESPSKQLKKP